MDHICCSRVFNTTLLISLIFSLKILGHIVKKLHPDNSQQFNAKITWCILSGFAQVCLWQVLSNTLRNDLKDGTECSHYSCRQHEEGVLQAHNPRGT